MASGQFSDATISIRITSVACSGSEPALLDCSFSTDSQSSCDAVEDSEIVCQGS